MSPSDPGNSLVMSYVTPRGSPVTKHPCAQGLMLKRHQDWESGDPLILLAWCWAKYPLLG